LIVNEVGRHPDECQIAACLPDHFMGGGKRNQMGEALHRDGVAVVNGVRHNSLK
jgi:hypothetical protein